MKAEKHIICKSDTGYVVSEGNIAGVNRILVAGEGKEPALMVDPATFEAKILSSEPGGCMGFAEHPDREDALFMITRFYPIFQSEEAGIDLCVMDPADDDSWSNRRILDLPFVHRIIAVKSEAGSFLFASTVCGGKDFQDDWSRPGTVYAIEIPSSLDGPWIPVPILENLHRNHGMTTRYVDGVPTIVVSADEGIFEIPMNKGLDDQWTWNRILEQPVSEVGFIDMDGDGQDELVTIEPFHGSTFRVYQQSNGTWQPVAESELGFGHGLSVGSIDGQESVVVGNRTGAKDLLLFQYSEDGQLDRKVLDSATGTAGTVIFSSVGSDIVVASNQAQSEYAAYVFKKGSTT